LMMWVTADGRELQPTRAFQSLFSRQPGGAALGYQPTQIVQVSKPAQIPPEPAKYDYTAMQYAIGVKRPPQIGLIYNPDHRR
jgi:hypothetical protein